MEKPKVMKKKALSLILALVVLAIAGPYGAYAATFTVNSAEDINDMNPGDSVCSTAAGTCTLRAAIQESNALGSVAMKEIKLTTGVYKLQLGTLEILDSVVITGEGAESTTIDGQLRATVFSVGGVGKSANVKISGVKIQKGSSNAGGGIFIAKGSSLFLTRSIVKDNRAFDSGGGIYNQGTLNVIESTITDNGFGTGGGGGILNWEGTATLSRSTVDNNNATGGGFRGGGGIENIGGQVSITNSTISRNKLTGGVSPRGGGIRNAQGATLNLTNVTIANNSLPPPVPNEARQGGGISNENSTVNLTNTLIDGNSAQTGPDCFGTMSSGDFNLISNTNDCNISGTNNILNQSAQLNQLAPNGGPTWTHALSAASPAIDKGSNVSFSDCPTMDQRGISRPFDGDGNGIKRCDIGAFEHGGYYVGRQGSNTNSCAQAQFFSTPKLNISNGANCLKPGDTLFVQAGLYAEQLSNVIPSGTSWTSPVIVTAFPGDVVTIRPSTDVSGVLTFIGPDQAYVVIDGMIVDCVNASNDCVSIQDGAHHIKIKNSEVKNSPGVGVLGGINNEFSDLNVHHNQSHGVHFNQPNNVIYGSVIHENGGNGIEIDNATTTQIYNNTISNNSGYGIVVEADVSGTVIMNNIISSNVEGAINDSGTGTIVKSNLN
jgi:CSLREA domain-containing protein